MTHAFARIGAAAAIATLSLAVAPAAHSQSQTQAPSPAPSASAPNASIPDAKLDAAAAAIQKVAGLKEKYQQQFDAATPGERPRIAVEANGAMEKAVTDAGLSVDEYQSILTVAQNNADVKDRLLQRIRPGED